MKIVLELCSAPFITQMQAWAKILRSRQFYADKKQIVSKSNSSVYIVQTSRYQLVNEEQL